MSNKPKIKAFCAAGCAWETVHMDDFLKSATFYEIGQPDGYAIVDAYRKYRIFADKGDENYNVTINFQSPVDVGDDYHTQATIPVDVGRREYFDIEILEAKYTSAGTLSATLSIVYEVNGEEKTLTVETVNYNLSRAVLNITGANQVLLYNDTAQILGKDGVTPVFEVDEVVTLEAGARAYVHIDNADPEHPLISFGIPIGNSGGMPTDEQVAAAVKKYLDENPVTVDTTATKPKIATISLLASKWVGEASPYSQIVAVEGATENSQVDLTPSIEQLAIFHQKDLAFVAENEDGVITVYALGDKPTNDYTMQVTITEVSV